MQLLPEEAPGKCGGPPGNAFELVYAKVTDEVRRAVHRADPVLAEWIRWSVISLHPLLLKPVLILNESVRVAVDGVDLSPLRLENCQAGQCLRPHYWMFAASFNFNHWSRSIA